MRKIIRKAAFPLVAMLLAGIYAKALLSGLLP